MVQRVLVEKMLQGGLLCAVLVKSQVESFAFVSSQRNLDSEMRFW